MQYEIELNGIISDGNYIQKFTEKNVDHIEISFGDKKININDSIKSALKLQELVKETIPKLRKIVTDLNSLNKRYTQNDVTTHQIKLLQTLLKESQTTLEEIGLARREK